MLKLNLDQNLFFYEDLVCLRDNEPLTKPL